MDYLNVSKSKFGNIRKTLLTNFVSRTIQFVKKITSVIFFFFAKLILYYCDDSRSCISLSAPLSPPPPYLPSPFLIDDVTGFTHACFPLLSYSLQRTSGIHARRSTISKSNKQAVDCAHYRTVCQKSCILFCVVFVRSFYFFYGLPFRFQLRVEAFTISR